MAVIARSAGKRRMHDILEKLGIVRSMRAVAADAIHVGGLDAYMSFDERRLFDFMAFRAHRLQRLDQKRLLLGEMRQVTSRAIFLRGGVGPLPGDLLIDVFMAVDAEVGTLRKKQLVEFRLVRAVALGAVPLGEGSVAALGILRVLVQIAVAVDAQFALVADDHPLDVAGMGIMAAKAVPFGEGLVVDPLAYRFHELGVA